VFWVISVYFNIKNTLPKSGTFLLGHPVYIYDCEHFVYELILLPINTASEIFLNKSGEVRSVDCIFIIGALACR